MNHYWNYEKGVYEQPYFTEVVWRKLMSEGFVASSTGSPAYYETPGKLWNSDLGDYLVHNQRLSAEYYRAARKVMGIE